MPIDSGLKYILKGIDTIQGKDEINRIFSRFEIYP